MFPFYVSRAAIQYETIFSDTLVLVHTLLWCVWVLALLIYQEEHTPVIGAKQNSRTGSRKRRLETTEGENMTESGGGESFYCRRMQVPFCICPPPCPHHFFLLLKSSVPTVSKS